MDSSIWLILLDKAVLPLLVAIVAPILIVLAKKAIDVFEKKTGLEVSVNQQVMLEELITKAIAYAEEQARKAIKKSDVTMDGESKLEHAIDFVKTGAQSLGIELKGEDIAKLIEAKLYDSREPGDVPTPAAPADEEE